MITFCDLLHVPYKILVLVYVAVNFWFQLIFFQLGDFWGGVFLKRNNVLIASPDPIPIDPPIPGPIDPLTLLTP